ncbi:MAG: helix-turn-helix domain-containing protein, partial [Rhodobacteraceae bacterium]
KAQAGPEASPAEARLVAALAALGPGLADVALRCCCLLEGLEVAERRMGWSARSGKIVLRIALTQLMRHYHARSEADRLIG